MAVDVVHQITQGLFVHDMVDDIKRYGRLFLQYLEEMITSIGIQDIFAVFSGVERIKGIDIGIRTTENTFEFVERKIADQAVIVFVSGLGTFMYQIQESLTRVETIHNLLGLFFSGHPDVAHLHNVDLGYDFPQQHPADGCFITYAMHAHGEAGMQIDRT